MSQPADRATAILARFSAAQNALIAKLRDLPAETAEFAPEAGAWTAAQVGWHVALCNNWSADVLLGSAPLARPADAEFRERFDPRLIPGRVRTAAALEPPSIVGRDSALERLRASGQRMSKAIASLTPERGAGYCVTLSFGTLSLFEFADFAAGHVVRHIEQVDRSLTRV
jgi:hypothetical protein